MLAQFRSLSDYLVVVATLQVVDPQLPSNADWREAGYRFLLEDGEPSDTEAPAGSKRRSRREPGPEYACFCYCRGCGLIVTGCLQAVPCFLLCVIRCHCVGSALSIVPVRFWLSVRRAGRSF